MSRKKKNYIDKKESKMILESYGFSVQELNFYQFRIRTEEEDCFFDWYHTTGSVVKTQGKSNIRVGTCFDAEELLEVIKNKL